MSEEYDSDDYEYDEKDKELDEISNAFNVLWRDFERHHPEEALKTEIRCEFVHQLINVSNKVECECRCMFPYIATRTCKMCWDIINTMIETYTTMKEEHGFTDKVFLALTGTAVATQITLLMCPLKCCDSVESVVFDWHTPLKIPSCEFVYRKNRLGKPERVLVPSKKFVDDNFNN